MGGPAPLSDPILQGDAVPHKEDGRWGSIHGNANSTGPTLLGDPTPLSPDYNLTQIRTLNY